MFKKIFVASIGVVLLVGSIVYIKLGQFTVLGEAAQNMVMPPTTVTSETISEAQWEQVITATATVSAAQGVTVSAEAGGRVTEILFESDATAEESQALLQLDTSTEESQLASAQASAALARTELARLRKLVKKKLSSQDAVDRASAEVKETVAQVGVIQTTIQKKTVRAPFSGRLGLRQVNPGQILAVGDPVVALQMLDPVYVDFSVPQQKLSRLKRGMTVRIASDASPEESFEGEITAINLEVDPVTRNVQVRSQVSNPHEKLRTGMFVNVEVVLPETRKVLAVPATAVLFAPFGNSVFVIDEKPNEETGETEKLLRQQFITLGQARGDYVDVTDGLKQGETVVTSGVFKLHTGMKVVIDNTLAPDNSLTPSPGNS
ncbi:MAG: efflux RND transporter periplasmic adaptor subunit [Gammaproteobacteria bacterium]|nr:efflux RND transporter periplasmic adaptor subunit [Gammaproteobacteria bacterium]